jgi:hypothetical protein
VWRAKEPEAAVGRSGIGGRVADWLPFCDALAALEQADSASVRALVER